MGRSKQQLEHSMGSKAQAREADKGVQDKSSDLADANAKAQYDVALAQADKAARAAQGQ
jgi:hypothetical protein